MLRVPGSVWCMGFTTCYAAAANQRKPGAPWQEVQLEDLRGKVFHNGGQVDGSTGTNTFGIVALAQQTMDTTHGELETCPG